MSIFTIGYEGLDTEGFLALLRTGDVETVVDIRALPLSRKPGFSKSTLRQTLERNGFDYLHVPELGCPKPIRDQYRQDENWSRYTADFLHYLAQQDDAIGELAAMATTTTCALLCYEADFNFCHRSMVADAMRAVNGLPIHHLQRAALRITPTDARLLEFA